jgi:hypothetical protein
MRTLTKVAKLTGHDCLEGTWTFSRHVYPLPVQHDDTRDAGDGLQVWCALTKNFEQIRSHAPHHAAVGATRPIAAASFKTCGCRPSIDSNQATDDVADTRFTPVDKTLQKFQTTECNAAGNVEVTCKAAVIT